MTGKNDYTASKIVGLQYTIFLLIYCQCADRFIDCLMIMNRSNTECSGSSRVLPVRLSFWGREWRKKKLVVLKLIGNIRKDINGQNKMDKGEWCAPVCVCV